MTVWKEKKEQQIVFDSMVTTPSNRTVRRRVVWQKDDGHIFIQKVISFSKKIESGGVIIDVGCGTGTLLNEINRNVSNSHYLIGIDISSESVKVAKQKNRAVDFIVCDIDALPLKDKVSQMVIVWNVLHHLPNLESLHKILRLLDSAGYLIVDDKINVNPLQEILISLYPLYPYKFKMLLKEKGNHIDPNGILPPIKRYRPQTYLKTIQQHSNEVRIVEIKYHGFFLLLGFLGIVSYFFPRISDLPMPADKLRLFEKRSILRWSAISMTLIAEAVKS